MIEDKHLHEAIDRIARTEDGRIFYLFLQRRLMAVSTADDTGALYRDGGERTFAAKLIGLMGKGIAESDASRTSSTGSPASGERIITFAVAGPRSVAGPRGAGRRVTADTRISGWDADESPGG